MCGGEEEEGSMKRKTGKTGERMQTGEKRCTQKQAQGKAQKGKLLLLRYEESNKQPDRVLSFSGCQDDRKTGRGKGRKLTHDPHNLSVCLSVCVWQVRQETI